jgi:hypothetical protein
MAQSNMQAQLHQAAALEGLERWREALRIYIALQDKGLLGKKC